MTFPWKAIWGVHAPRRVAFFAWSASWVRILTIDNLMRRGYQLAGWCCMCRQDGETINHLLIHCDLAFGLWSFVFRTFGILWVLPGCVLDLFFGWYNGLGKIHSKVWNVVPPCLLWTLWWERNSRIFENTECTDSQLHNFKNFFLIRYMTGLQLGVIPDLILLLLFWILFTPPHTYLFCNFSPLLCSYFMHT